MSEEAQKLTPMFEQYKRIKKDYPDALLFYRMGDFYELFFEDAEVAARELQIALTSRNPQAESPIAMCGVPWHSAEGYISQLIAKGHKVAICEQIEDPKAAKGLVERAVVRVLTAATVVEDGSLEARSHSYLAAIYWNEGRGSGGIAWVDVSTGYWTGLLSKKLPDLWQWAQKMNPRELLLPEGFSVPKSLLMPDTQLVRVPERSHFDLKRSTDRLLAAQGVAELGALGLEKSPELVQACGALVAYLEQTQMQNARHLGAFVPLSPSRYMMLDEVTERNLELFRRLDGRKGPGTLRDIVDMTLSPMGARLLEESLRRPWRELAPIMENQEVVGWLKEERQMRRSLREALKAVYDLERLSTRIALNRTSPKDFLALKNSLKALPRIHAAFAPDEGSAADAKTRYGHVPPALFRLLGRWDNLEEYAELLEKAFVDNPPAQITDGGLFKAGFTPELDELLRLAEHGEEALEAMLRAEQQKAGLPKLKMGYNRVFGYFFELSRANAAETVPEHFIRRQTLMNAERFTTEALKELEEKLQNASQERKKLEYELFQQIRKQLADARPRLVFMAELVARLDYWQSLAEVAERHKWNKPLLNEDLGIAIHEGRHPVVESVIGQANFVPNDVRIDEQRRILLITGPNMAGKSTILRQTALICILAQMGSFVPAEKAVIGLCDRVFSRVGASDNLSAGQSTFMVEMMETARILRQATKKSLVILDEIGRGTSTFDGLALAWAVVEDLARRANGGIRTMFATHYHELTALEGRLEGLHTMNVAIREWMGDIVFLRRLVPGPSDRSYGIEVAKLAGVPQTVVARARELLAGLEQQGSGKAAPGVPRQNTLLPGLEPAPKSKKEIIANPVREVPHPLLVALADVELDSMTPIKALNMLSEWKMLWGEINESNV